MLTFRQPGDMARYVADNDPGQIAAGFSNLEDFLAAGNKIPEYKMGGRQPIQAVDAQQSPFDLSKINKNPYGTEFVGIGEDQTNLFGYRVPDEIIKAQEERLKNIGPIDFSGVIRSPESSIPGYGRLPLDNQLNVTPPSVPLSEQTPISGLPEAPKAIRSPGLPQPTDPVGILDSIRTVNPIVSGPQGIASTATAPKTNQFQGFDDRLTKIEEGIASLLQNRGQQSNFDMQPRFNFGMQPRFNTSGLGYFFRPDGGI